MGRFQFLGTGGSMGIPVIGCDCEVCTSTSPHDKRLRPSAVVSIGEKTFLIDPGPDLRTQALRFGVKKLDGILVTHAHQDHVGGLDDLRIYCIRQKRSLPCLLSKETLDELKVRFAYTFHEKLSEGQFVTKIEPQCINDNRGGVQFEGCSIRYVTFEQAKMKVLGFRFGNLAYLSDIKEYPETIYEDMKGVQHLIISAIRYVPSPLHFTVDDAVEFSRKIKARHTWLTHISHDLRHEKTEAYLPENVHMAYDGLEISFDE